MNILLIILAICFFIYVLYSWVDHFWSGRYKKIYKETPISPRLKNGREPTLRDLNEDVSKEILDHNFDSTNDKS